MRLQIFALLMTLAADPSALHAQARSPVPRPDAVRPWVSDSVLALVDLLPMRDAAEEGRPGREIRIWLEYGIVGGPRPMLRLVEANGRVTGDLVYWWAVPSYGVIADSHVKAKVAEMMEQSLADSRRSAVEYCGCNTPVRHGTEEACRARLKVAVDWTSLLVRIDSLDPWTLPDPRTLDPPLRGGLDGWAVDVETRIGRVYRTVSYWAPDSTQGPEAQRVRQLAKRTSARGVRSRCWPTQ